MADNLSDILDVRFGYGRRSGSSATGSPESLLEAAVKCAEAEPGSAAGETAARLQKVDELRTAARSEKQAEKRRELGKSTNSWMHSMYLQDAHRRLIAAVSTECPFYDRLVAFWSNHFTVSVVNRRARLFVGPFEIEALRPHVMGTFEDMLLAVELHPAMMIYLDLINSVGPNSPAGQKQGKGLNENLAREILELHTLGVNGGYSQADVTAFAKIMTGWTLDHKAGEVRFAKRRAEPGAKRFLGTEIGGQTPAAGDYPAALRLLARHPSTARLIASKLVSHFIADDPPPEAIGKVEAAFRDSGGALAQVYRALLDLPEARRPVGAKARSDFEFVVAALRAAGIPSGNLEPMEKKAGRTRPNPLSVGALTEMNQRLWSSPSPAGWPEKAEEWLGPTALAQRLRWIPEVVFYVRDKTAVEFLDRVLGPLASQTTRSVVMAASNREEGLGLVLASPEFNRR